MAKKSFGTITKTGGSGGTAVAELYSVTPPGLSVDMVETTHHGLADRFRTWLSTLGDWGELKIEMAMAAATITQMKAALFDDAVSWFISFEFGATDITMTFTGLLKSLEFAEAPVDGKYVMMATIKPSGDITFGGLS